jgi:hypothetical protein
MLQGFRADVAKVDIDFSTLRMLIPQHKYLIPDVANVCFRMLQLLLTYFLLQTLILDVADVEF